MARAADGERPSRSGRMSRERIARSLSGLVVTVAMAVTLAGSFVLGYLVLSRELFLRKRETDRTDKGRESFSRLAERLSLSSARTMGPKATPVTLSPPP